jgi:proton-translocating NADH-quinone oxidoreductase chain L
MPWLKLGVFHINWGLLFDEVTYFMCLVVLGVSLLVHLYSISYMRGDPHVIRFFAYLSLFTFFMLILISGNNFLQMFVGWEGVGLCSYLLISFWYTRLGANRAAIKALIMNRIGDVSLLFAMALFCLKFHSLDYGIIFLMTQHMSTETIIFFNQEYSLITFISFFLFIGAVGKSAQIGLHTWLPDAMEGPTPVSALIHAATMVTAGIYLMIRCSPIIEYTTGLLPLLVIFGALTAVMGSFLAVVQKDIKKIIAYSTCSQLGYMLVACGLSNYHYAFYHLITHASYKALLFLSAGSVIHAVTDEQDMRRMGTLLNLLPLTFILMLLGSLSLMGSPWFSGYYSKDLIIELVYLKDFFINTFSITSICITIATFLTCTYSLFLIWSVFFKIDSFLIKSTFLELKNSKYRDLDIILLLPLILLAYCSIFLGYFIQPYFDYSCGFFENILIMAPSSIIIEFLPIYLKIIPFLIFNILLSAFMYYSMVQFGSIFLRKKTIINDIFFLKIRNLLLLIYTPFLRIINFFYKFFLKGWYFDILYNKIIARPFFLFAYFMLKIIDKGYVELLGPRGSMLLISFFSNFILNLHKNIFVRYLEIFIFVLFFMIIFI